MSETPRKKLRLGVLISGNGGNLQAIINACLPADFPAEVAVVVSNRADAYGLVRAANAGIPEMVIDHRQYAKREAFDAALHEKLSEYEVDLVVLAGFMRLLTPGFVEQWQQKMINIHPSLLPSFKGANAVADALAAGVKITGCTVHYVVPEMDAGPIIVQAATPVFYHDTEESLSERIHQLEHTFYPLAIRAIADGGVKLDKRGIVQLQSSYDLKATHGVEGAAHTVH